MEIFGSGDLLLAALVVGFVQYMKGSLPWLANAAEDVYKKRVKLLTGMVAACLSFAYIASVSTAPVWSIAFLGDWVIRFMVSWIASMGGFDWLKLAIPDVWGNKRSARKKSR